MLNIAAAILIALAPAQDDKRIAELERRIAELEKQVRELKDAIAKREGAGAAPAAPVVAAAAAVPALAGNERTAINSLKTITTAQADFRSNDRDGNLVNDFWTGDVNALYALCPSPDHKSAEPAPAPEKTIRLIEPAVAESDAAPRAMGGVFVHAHTPKPKAGYFVRALAKYGEKGALSDYRNTTAGAGSPYAGNHHRNKFGFVAFPSEHGKSGNLTFIVNQENVIWAKDTGGKAPESFPESPEKDGWRKLD